MNNMQPTVELILAMDNALSHSFKVVSYPGLIPASTHAIVVGHRVILPFLRSSRSAGTPSIFVLPLARGEGIEDLVVIAMTTEGIPLSDELPMVVPGIDPVWKAPA